MILKKLIIHPKLKKIKNFKNKNKMGILKFK